MYPTIDSLGECRVPSPLRHIGPGAAKFNIDSERILCDDRSKDNVEVGTALPSPLAFEVAGPRERIYFDPGQTIAAVVSCGGLCPGLNDVIRGIVMELWHRYHVTEIVGIRYGYEGLVLKHGHVPLQLQPEMVSNIQSFGGTWRGHSIRHWRRWHPEGRSRNCRGDPAQRS